MPTLKTDSPGLDALRPDLNERRVYQALGPPEEFIVPILSNEINQVLEWIAKEHGPGRKVLDIGCGGQPLRKSLVDLGYEYFSCDAVKQHDIPIDFIFNIDGVVPADLLNKGTFSLIICTEVLEHVADWNAAFSNLRLLSATSGLILVTVPHFYPLHEVPYDFWRPTPYAIEYHASRNAMQVEYKNAAGDAWDVLGTLLGNCFPRGRQRTFTDRSLAVLVKMFRGVLFKLLKSRWLQRHVKMDGDLYISNIFVLRSAQIGLETKDDVNCVERESAL